MKTGDTSIGSQATGSRGLRHRRFTRLAGGLGQTINDYVAQRDD
jgi:hypothetical protein